MPSNKIYFDKKLCSFEHEGLAGPHKVGLPCKLINIFVWPKGKYYIKITRCHKYSQSEINRCKHFSEEQF